MAVTSGSVELAELLLTFGAPPNEPLIVRTADPDAGTVETSLYALHAAVRMGDFAMASLLIAFNANVDASIQFTTDEGFSVVVRLPAPPSVSRSHLLLALDKTRCSPAYPIVRGVVHRSWRQPSALLLRTGAQRCTAQ